MNAIMQEKRLTQPQQAAAVPKLPHNLTLESRSTLTATGVVRVISCDEQTAALETQQGNLLIGGQGLQVSELSMESGAVKIFGQIEYLQCSQPSQSAGGFFRRLVR